MEWAKNNRAKINAYKRKWRKNNPQKTISELAKYRDKKLQNGVYKILQKEIIKLKNSDCFYCGSKSKITLDHVIPVSRGGRHSIGNLVSACGSCNSSKGNKLIREWKR